MSTVIAWDRIGATLIHPTAKLVLEQLADGTEVSASMVSKKFGEPLASVSYHVKMLRKRGWIEETRTEPRRGAVEHFYKLGTEIKAQK